MILCNFGVIVHTLARRDFWLVRGYRGDVGELEKVTGNSFPSLLAVQWMILCKFGIIVHMLARRDFWLVHGYRGDVGKSEKVTGTLWVAPPEELTSESDVSSSSLVLLSR